eukprot:TRINITY_DN491_c0_g1_i1.p1 TRINITY_DN491_c0_g1~~TRINITY_DN491_c0_g1_i1.p1  ORF type:complete len:280 (-),score=46.42 TRINITY_DN491_c0_g1_i1:331-1059(-)
MASLDPETFKKFKIEEKVSISHNVLRFRVALPSSDMVLGLPIGQHISLQGVDEEGEFMRPYTPTTLDSDVGYFDLVIKIYPQGKMSQFVSKLAAGDELSVRGPKGRFKYTPNMVTEFGMIAGGTGITPMFQVARAILENPKDTTKVSLLYANVGADDILLKDEIDAMAGKYPGRFSVYYVLNNPPPVWDGGQGFITADMIKKHLPAPSETIQILRCGPPPMMKAMAAACESLGYTKSMQFSF